MIFREVLRTQSNICDGDFFTNIANDGLFSQKKRLRRHSIGF